MVDRPGRCRCLAISYSSARDLSENSPAEELAVGARSLAAMLRPPDARTWGVLARAELRLGVALWLVADVLP
jgi:hypothetical protein